MRKTRILDLVADNYMTDFLRGNGGCYSSRHFDVKNGALFPSQSLISDSGAVSNKILSMTVVKGGGTDGVVLGLVKPSTNYGVIYSADVTGTSPSWSSPLNWDSGSGTSNYPNTLCYYKGYAFMTISTGYLRRFGLLADWSTAAWNTTYQTVTDPVDVAPVHHKFDDCLYVFGEKTVYRLNNTTWDGSVLTLPDSHKIAAACQYSNFIAIGMNSRSALDPAFIALWGRDGSVSTLQERIEIGWGKILGMGTVNGQLVLAFSEGADNSYSQNKGRVVVKVYRGGYFQDVNFVSSDTTSSVITPCYFSDGTGLYFKAALYHADSDGLSTKNFTGIWRTDETGRMTIPVYNSSFEAERFSKIANIFYLFSSTGDTVEKTTGNTTTTDYTDTSIYETRILNEGDPTTTKKLVGVTVAFEPLLSSGSVSLYYRLPGTATWTLIATESTDGATRLRSITSLPQYKEIQFRIESTGKAIITDMRYAFDVINDDIY